ncbi:MAG: hypothetical protein LBQ35_00360 [Spirochaetaceae bacterium]|nr:hypothetical protein [Spirochaetaceae bacterium]
MSLRERVRNLPLPVREWAVFAAWAGGILLAGILAWALTAPLRSRVLLGQVNRSLARQESAFRLEAPLAVWGRPGRASQAGFWFSLAGSGKSAVVFPLMLGSRSVTVLGILDESGGAAEIIPLSAHALGQFADIPPGLLDLYRRRMEASSEIRPPAEAEAGND